MAVTTPGVSAPTESQPAPPRRAPSQHRSRVRVERMLAAATDLIAEKGSDAKRMGEVAEKAGVSIGSLYQYFPDKGAIIRMLDERYNAQGRECIEAELANVRDMADLRDAFTRLVEAYYAMFLAEPVMRDIWSGTQADKALRNIDLADSRANGAVLDRVLRRLRGPQPPLPSSYGVAFHQPVKAFRDPFGVERIDDRENYGEERINLLDMCEGVILHVTYAERDKDIRLISARRAEKHEQEDYYRENSV